MTVSIIPFLRGASFDPDIVGAMSVAFEQTCLSLDLPVTALGARTIIANQIIGLAKRGERRAHELRERVLRQARHKNGGDSGSSIGDVTITPELLTRRSRPPNIAAELAVMRALADTITTDPSQIFQVCVELTLELCRADTCGISVLEHTAEGEEIFRWVALAGDLKRHFQEPISWVRIGFGGSAGRPARRSFERGRRSEAIHRRIPDRRCRLFGDVSGALSRHA